MIDLGLSKMTTPSICVIKQGCLNTQIPKCVRVLVFLVSFASATILYIAVCTSYIYYTKSTCTKRVPCVVHVAFRSTFLTWSTFYPCAVNEMCELTAWLSGVRLFEPDLFPVNDVEHPTSSSLSEEAIRHSKCFLFAHLEKLMSRLKIVLTHDRVIWGKFAWGFGRCCRLGLLVEKTKRFLFKKMHSRQKI